MCPRRDRVSNVIGSFPEFAARLSALLGVEAAAAARPEDSLYDVWCLDSLQAFQLIILTEALAECDVPPPMVPQMFTVGDAYGNFKSLV